jgi:hypothetical protein
MNAACPSSPSRYTNLAAWLTARAPKMPSVALIPYSELRADHVAWEWPRELNELATILNKLAWWFAS